LQDINLYNENLWTKHQLGAQIFKLNDVISIDHIKLVLYRVLSVFQQKINISNHPSMEFLLFLSGQRQIKRALEIAGIKPQGESIEIGFTVFGDQSKLRNSLPEIVEFLSKYTVEPVLPRTKQELAVILQKHCILKNALRVLQSYNYNIEKISTFQDLLETIPQAVVEQIIIDILNEQMVKVQMSNLKGEK
jgi:tRNA threonylcarbamoyladenosine modification (KEOPS) complex Cgi121 subunit